MADYNEFFNKFTQELTQWCHTGKEPAAGNQDVKLFLDLQEKRLQKYNLQLDITMETQGGVMNIGRIQEQTPLKNFGIFQMNQTLYGQLVNKTTIYRRNGKELLKRDGLRTFYETIISPQSDLQDFSDLSYICPNCGAVSTVRQLQEEGCPYCKNRFLISDLYPKVTNFYELDSQIVRADKINQYIHSLGKAALINGCIWVGLTAIGMFSEFNLFSIILLPLSFLTGAAIVAMPMYFGISIYCLLSVFIQAGKSIRVTSGSSKTRATVARELMPLDPSFSYGYFESKAINLARILMLSDTPESFIQYEGPDLGKRFKDVVEVRYRGGISVRRIEHRDGKIILTLKLYLKTTRAVKKKLQVQDENVLLQMYHYERFPVVSAFSVVNVKCKNCGASFDARTNKKCPHCGTDYDAGRDDWIVTKIK